jgi:hypothetical protein
MTYSLVIKARTSTEARRAAEDRGIHLDRAFSNLLDEVIASADVSLDQLQRWSNESDGRVPPYPYGTLVQFDELDR